ncbi:MULTISPECIES: Pls/PosA family non-ribosomal peptide synthetase [Citricoccus]|uniref:Pls/PosA family non-ribosomal peptide synthetase n=1 Tax=Citricoccus TaxID=169133 RepID=UPI000255DF95|nr:Pls/PosA family non-ribosomal peptide synthetase [Citricoccus sp. CH26A]
MTNIDLQSRSALTSTDQACLHELFEQQSDAHPESTALICGEVSLTYGELDAQANRLAHYLRARQVGPGSLVGLFYERSEMPIVAILGCLKAGAAYVPLDPGHPDDRIQYIVSEASIETVLTERVLAERCMALATAEVVATDVEAADIAACADRRLTRTETGLTPEDLCYVIFTSGTTGRPKGVMTEHRNATHFIPAFNRVCSTTREDRIYQGFSLGFDGSVEEIWMAFSNGASLVVGTRSAPRFGNDLAQHLTALRVTYFSTVPTMLATMTADIPSLRQVVVSGEACPPQLVADWARPGRLMLNVYGPTEATVNTTAFVCEPGRSVTIGKPLPGYVPYILDSTMHPVAPGEMGELYIGGAGISRGYLNQPELTSKQFLAHPDRGGRLYRTGDLVRANEDGEIEFFGRIDGQVKIRGYRVELAEIEAVLREDNAIRSAAVKVRRLDGVDHLAAYVVLEPSAELDRSGLLATLRSRLPSYMVPTSLDVLEELPRLTSGKIDRGKLPDARTPLVDGSSIGERPVTEREQKIADAWAAVFGIPEVGVDQDFFLDLGGHSLLAARTVAALREKADCRVAVRDLYAYPTVRQLSQHSARAHETTDVALAGAYATPPPTRRSVRKRVAALQAGVILGLLLVFSLPAVVIVPVIDGMLQGRTPVLEGVIFLLVFGLILWPVLLLVGVGSKWVVIGRYKPGAYPLWGSYYIRWWIVQRLQGLSGLGMLAGTPLMTVYYRLMGAKVGRNCALETGLCSIWDTVRIGDDSTIGADTQLLGYRIENGYLLIGTLEIGDRCFVGAHSALGLDVQMGDGSRLDDQSLLPDGTILGADEQRRGSPAEPTEVHVPVEDIRRYSLTRLVLFCVGVFVLGMLSGLLFGLPALAMALFWLVAAQQGWFLPAAGLSLLAVPLMVVFSCFWVALFKAVLLRRARTGVYELYTFYYLRHWMAYSLMRSSRTMFLPVFTTIYLPPWMRLLGAKVGRHSEMSTVWSFIPELLTVGEGSFFADGAILGGRRTFGGHFELHPNTVGRRSFVGNSAMLPVASSLGDNSLLGVLSVPPSRTEPTPDGTDWLGSPAFNLPNRQKVAGFDDGTTYLPSRKMYVRRGVVDALRILIPAYTQTVLGLTGLVAVILTYQTYGVWIMLLILPGLALTLAIIAIAVVVVLKWTVMGRFHPVVVPLWSPYVWFNEMLNGAYESLMSPIVAQLFGTPFAAPVLRLLGCRIGKNCYIGSSLFSEFDLIQIGDFAALNAGSIIQNHLFEDRIMKSSHLVIGEGCSVGNMAVVLYDTVMEEDAVVGPLSLLMKGETMPAGNRWHGIPTVQG